MDGDGEEEGQEYHRRHEDIPGTSLGNRNGDIPATEHLPGIFQKTPTWSLGAHPMEIPEMSNGTFLGHRRDFREVIKAIIKNGALPLNRREGEAGNARGRQDISSLSVECLICFIHWLATNKTKQTHL